MTVDVDLVPPLVVKVRDAARILQISESHVYALLDRREIETIHIGRSLRIPVSALEAYVDQLREVS